MADAEATTEAAQRLTMSFVAVKTEEQQARGMLFRTRDLLVRQRTQTINALRGHLAEFGVIAPQGPAHVSRLASALEDPCSGLPEQVRELAGLLLEQIAGSRREDTRIGEGCAHQRPPGRRGGAPHDDTGGRANHCDGAAGPSHRRWRAFGAGATSPHGSGSFQGSTRPAASPGWARYPRWASATSGGF